MALELLLWLLLSRLLPVTQIGQSVPQREALGWWLPKTELEVKETQKTCQENREFGGALTISIRVWGSRSQFGQEESSGGVCGSPAPGPWQRMGAEV